MILRCPHCGKVLDEEKLLEAIDPAAIHKKSGSLRGKSGDPNKKGHSSAVARRAALTLWCQKGVRFGFGTVNELLRRIERQHVEAFYLMLTLRVPACRCRSR